MDFQQKNPQALASLRGNVYEEKIINLIKSKSKPNTKIITKEEAEKILKKEHDHNHDHSHEHEKNKETKPKKEITKTKKAKTVATKTAKSKKVSKK